MALANGTAVKLGDLRIKIAVDPDFDHNLTDWAEEIRDDVIRDLDSGISEAYEITIQRAVPGGWEFVDSSGGSVHSSGYSGTYNTPDGITDDQLRAAASEMIAQLPSA